MKDFKLHDLGGSEFFEGKLPSDLLWDAGQFEAAWLLHPQEQHEIMMHGKKVLTPRWQQAYGHDYHYTGRVNQALPVPEFLEPLLAWAQATVYPGLNGILLNWYEGPSHYIGPHHDSVKGMVPDAPIVTVSFGETRVFRVSRGKGEGASTWDFFAPPGTVFVMPYATNLAVKHAVPKFSRYLGKRISVTFRAFAAEGLTGAAVRAPLELI